MSARSSEKLLRELLDGIIKRDLQKIQSVIHEGADVNGSEDHANLRPLHFAVQHNFLPAIKALISSGANLFAESSDGETALDIAKLYKNKAVIEYLKKAMSNTLL